MREKSDYIVDHISVMLSQMFGKQEYRYLGWKDIL